MTQPILLHYTESDLKKMFTEQEELALRDVQATGHDNAWVELEKNHNSLFLWTSRAWLEDMFQATKVWKNGIPLGADGMFNFVKGNINNAVIVTFGTKTNYLDQEKGEKRQNFRFFGIAVYRGENTTAVVSQYAVYRMLAKQMFGVNFPQVVVWNSDDHRAYRAMRQVCFPRSYFAQCMVHVLRSIMQQKGTFKDLNHADVQEFHAEIDLLRKSGSREQFGMLADSFLANWAERVADVKAEKANKTSAKILKFSQLN